MFYNLLVKDTLEEDGGGGGGDAPAAAGGDAVDAAVAAVDLENSKAAVEVSQSFAQSSNYFWSYLIRLVLWTGCL